WPTRRARQPRPCGTTRTSDSSPTPTAARRGTGTTAPRRSTGCTSFAGAKPPGCPWPRSARCWPSETGARPPASTSPTCSTPASRSSTGSSPSSRSYAPRSPSCASTPPPATRPHAPPRTSAATCEEHAARGTIATWPMTPCSGARAAADCGHARRSTHSAASRPTSAAGAGSGSLFASLATERPTPQQVGAPATAHCGVGWGSVARVCVRWWWFMPFDGACSAVDGDELAVVQPGGGVAGADDGGDAVLAGDERGVSGEGAAVGDHCGGSGEQWCPGRCGAPGDEDVPGGEVGEVLWTGDDADRAGRSSCAGGLPDDGCLRGRVGAGCGDCAGDRVADEPGRLAQGEWSDQAALLLPRGSATVRCFRAWRGVAIKCGG